MRHSVKQRSSHPVILLTVGAIAAAATLSALYFASQARHQALATESTARELFAANSELASAREQLAAYRSRTVATASMPPDAAPTPAAAGAPSVESTPRSPASAELRSTFHSPAMREMLGRTRLANLRPIYDPLLTQFNLSPEERARFYDLQLMVDDPAISLDKVPSEAETPEERAQIANQIRQNRDAALQQLSSLLGGQGYQAYESYRATESERMLVQQFRQQTDPQSPQINDWQYDRLRDLMIQSRSQYPIVNDDFSASDAAVLMQAAQILTPDQLASFGKYLQNQEDIRQMMRNVLPAGG